MSRHADDRPSLGSQEWALWTTTARLVVTDARWLPAARALVEEYLAAVDDAANRFRADSEIRRPVRAADGTVVLGSVLADLVAEALLAAELSDGDVDPTVGTALRRIGYDRSLELVGGDRSPLRAVVRAVPGWRTLRLDDNRLRMPEGVELDLGATAKAVAADRAATLVHDALGVGVLVSLGGDIATAGPVADGAWQIHVQDRAEDPATQVSLPAGSAIATSSTVNRSWERGHQRVHHIIDPRTGEPANTPWRSVTVAAPTCALANTFTTAAVVRGWSAVGWLDGLGLPARFLDYDGHLHLTAAWPRAVAL